MTKVLSVTDCVEHLKQMLGQHFSAIWIEGEVVSLSRSPAGHWYFTLKDDQSSLSCAFFKYDVLSCRDAGKIVEGKKVKIWGKLDIYAPRGSLQVIVKKLIVGGAGSLIEQFEQLKKNLAAEGLFDPENKKPIPQLPSRVGVITAPDSAACADFLNVFKRRSFYMDVVIFPSLVQGESAAGELRSALEQAIAMGMNGQLDVIVLTRGGGASEDLWCFNDEGLAWDIFNSPIPIVNAVGHQVDFTIADFVADYRCETPTAAAELLTKYQLQLQERVPVLGKQLKSIMQQKMSHWNHSLLMHSPQKIIESLQKEVAAWRERLNRVSRLEQGAEILNLQEKSYYLDELWIRLYSSMQTRIRDYQAHLSRKFEVLQVVAPHHILERGFCYVQNNGGEIIKTGKEFNRLDENTLFELVFCDTKIKQKKVTS